MCTDTCVYGCVSEINAGSFEGPPRFVTMRLLVSTHWELLDGVSRGTAAIFSSCFVFRAEYISKYLVCSVECLACSV